METIFMNTENDKTNGPHKFVLNLSQRLDLRSSNTHVGFQNLSVYYTWKNIRKQYKNNKLKIKQSNLFKRPPLQDDHSSKMTNTESTQADSHTIVTV